MAATAVQVRSADPVRDNAALCALARHCPQGRRLRFYHHREDFWERCRGQADAEVLVAEQANVLVGTVTVARKMVWLGQLGWQPAAYICDLMVDPEQRGQGLGRQLLTATQLRCFEARLLYCYIVEDNTPSRRLFESQGFRAYPRRLLYHVILPRRRNAPANAFKLCATSTVADTAPLREQYDLVEALTAPEDVLRAQRQDSTAWTVRRRHGAQVFVGLPWYIALAAHFVPLLPRRGHPVHIWSLHYLRSEGPEQLLAIEELLQIVAEEANRERMDAVVVPQFENDPQSGAVVRRTLTGWGAPPGAAKLYVAGELASALLDMKRPLLLSPRDA
jgi:ribosomal protein S18 acetylase RimI-like enzyme